MILTLKRAEISVLLLHMAMSRKNARNVFKRNYRNQGKQRVLDLLTSFDEIKDELELIISETSEDEGELISTLHFNINEMSLLQSFLSSYVPLLDKTLKTAGNMLDEDIKQVEILSMIETKSRKMIEGAAIG